MVTEKDVQHIAELADVGIDSGELGTFTHQFNAILEYFDISSCQDVEGVNLSRPDDDDFVLFALH